MGMVAWRTGAFKPLGAVAGRGSMPNGEILRNFPANADS
jgi:hypothetical protein